MPAFNNNSAAYANHPTIQIPPEFPRILKQYTKAAIRTQPKDLLLWSVSYFRCLANAEIPPVKERLEYPVPATESGLTPGLLRVLHKQLGLQDSVRKDVLKAKWRGLCLQLNHLEAILKEDNDNVQWRPFLVEAAASIFEDKVEVVTLIETVCEAMADLPEGESSSLNKEDFLEILRLAGKKCDVETEQVENFLDELAAKRDDGKLAPKDLKHEDCPKF